MFVNLSDEDWDFVEAELSARLNEAFGDEEENKLRISTLIRLLFEIKKHRVMESAFANLQMQAQSEVERGGRR